VSQLVELSRQEPLIAQGFLYSMVALSILERRS